MTVQLQRVTLGIIRPEEAVLHAEHRRTGRESNKAQLHRVIPGGKIAADEDTFAATEREVLAETDYAVRATEQLDCENTLHSQRTFTTSPASYRSVD
jgi:8-oxo-dGTP pyrophosphatase MutT (NUDIX family)